MIDADVFEGNRLAGKRGHAGNRGGVDPELAEVFHAAGEDHADHVGVRVFGNIDSLGAGS